VRSPLSRLIVAVLVATALTATLVVVTARPASAAWATPPSPEADAAYVHRVVFDLPIARFARVADGRGPIWFDWSTDFCSAPLVGSTGRSFDFRLACLRHDFAYRNTKLLDVRYNCPHRPPGRVCAFTDWRHGRFWNATTRHAIDRQFRRDMRAHCWSRSLWDWQPCLAWAETYYRAVRIAGGP
jgi:hypothetical protein